MCYMWYLPKCRDPQEWTCFRTGGLFCHRHRGSHPSTPGHPRQCVWSASSFMVCKPFLLILINSSRVLLSSAHRVLSAWYLIASWNKSWSFTNLRTIISRCCTIPTGRNRRISYLYLIGYSEGQQSEEVESSLLPYYNLMLLRVFNSSSYQARDRT